ncbi:hypothetical protein SS50377_24856 [Spironucleus salmonicida]|uniref:Transmembrane protein n=1 Tax=Spironucleus salmonicida TaxID=348837 RepID=A0A9P8LRE0_9EUKA|nr:hypothetical protein SS50377_24856 [Spironucleus salmonicida]
MSDYDCKKSCLTYCEKFDNLELCFLGITVVNVTMLVIYFVIGLLVLGIIGFAYDRYKLKNGFQRVKICLFIYDYKHQNQQQVVQPIQMVDTVQYYIVQNNQAIQQSQVVTMQQLQY